MTLSRGVVYNASWLAGLARWRYDPWPALGASPALDLVSLESPWVYLLLQGWWYLTPPLVVLLGGSLVLSLYEVWGPRGGGRERGALPLWPKPPGGEPQLVLGEQHHPIEAVAVSRPSWLVLPARGLYCGVAIFGAVGSGKTSACMRPFAQQLFSWGAGSERALGGLVLEVKGDFCHDVRSVMEAAGRGEDYLELGIGGQWAWNPLDAPEMDSYSLAYQIASLLNQLFGKGKEPFWQMAYTNLARWVIELHRLPGRGGGWVTLQDVYRCAIDPELFGQRIEETAAGIFRANLLRCSIPAAQLVQLPDALRAWGWQPEPDGKTVSTSCTRERLDALRELGLDPEVDAPEAFAGGVDDNARRRMESLATWYEKDWLGMDVKLRTSIVEGLSVFLGLFEDPDVARVFCPPPPRDGMEGGQEDPNGVRTLPRLRALIERGAVLALNMPGASNPALARAVGVFLKAAWLSACLQRPADMARPENADRYWRPAVFLCDEYQQFCTVGEDDPSGDERAFSLSRQARLIPIVAAQSITSLKSATRGGEGWRVLVQSLRTRVFLSLSDSESAKLAAEMCGRVQRMKPSYTLTESGGRSAVSWIRGGLAAAKGSVGVSKSYKQEREALFEATVFQHLDTCQAIAQPFDGRKALTARRVYLKPHFLPRQRGYFEAVRRGEL